MATADSNAIRVKVTKFADRKFFVMYFDNPVTGKRETRSTKQTTQREAERAAAKWEAELQAGRYKPTKQITWADFRERSLNCDTSLDGGCADTFPPHGTRCPPHRQSTHRMTSAARVLSQAFPGLATAGPADRTASA